MASSAELEAMFNSAPPSQKDLGAMFESAAPAATTSSKQPQAPRERGYGEEVLRQLGLTARAVAEGVGSLPNAVGDAVGLDSSRGWRNLLTKVGLPEAQTDMEKLSQFVVGGGASAALPIGAGSQMAKGTSEAVRRIGTELSRDAGKQMALSGVAGGAAGAAAEAGGNGLEQMGVGTAAAVLAALAARGTSSAAGRVRDIADAAFGPNGATRAAGRVAVDVSKERAGAVARALRNGEPTETAAQAAVPAGSAEFAGLEQMVAGRNPSIYGPDGTIVKAQSAYVDQLWNELNAATRQLREIELSGANVAGEVGARLKQQIAEKQASLAAALQTSGRAATESAQQQVLADTPWFPVSGMPRISGRYTHNTDRVPEWASAADDANAIAAQRSLEKSAREFQLNSISAHGMQPLTVGNIISNIDAKLSTPGLRASDTATTVLGAFKDKIQSIVGPDGVIDSRDLYTIRKEMGNRIGVLARQEQWDKRLTEGLVHDVQKSIDEAIGMASGSMRKDGSSGWTDYLKKYSEGAKRIEGIGERQEVAARMGNAGREEAQRIFNADGVPVTLPNLLSRPMMVANAIVRFMDGKGGQKTRDELSRLMQPQNKDELARVMQAEMALRTGRNSMADMLRSATVSGAYGSVNGR